MRSEIPAEELLMAAVVEGTIDSVEIIKEELHAGNNNL